ncbi:transglycosylase SLT domain-containing protein [Hirschia litorea]|uniref:Transglycosylase SLT domain-containing protein n=1 Tax=Hirschia litorea TaxID=1199156 RepID=A0ABW2IFX2_9PROT
MDSMSRASSAVGAHSQNLDPKAAIRVAAKETGADFSYLLKTAKRESGMDPTAKATTSSATGLFQFTDDTWLRMIDRYGAKYGLDDAANSVQIGAGRAVVADPKDKSEILAMREDPVMASRMAGELANENATILRRGIGREPTSKELYVAHFMGPSGAVELINAVQQGSTQKAEDLFPAAARANRAIFNERSGQARSVAGVYAHLTGGQAPQAENTPAQEKTPVQDVGSYMASFQSDVSKMPIAPSNGIKMGVQLSSTMVMTLLDLQSRHFENAEKQQEDKVSIHKT